MRVLLDANLFISYLLFPARGSSSNTIVRAAIVGEFFLLLPDELLSELATRIRIRPYLAQRIHPSELDEFVQILASVSETIPKITESIPAVTRDPKEDYLLAYALVGEADYLVTGDQNLLVLKQIDEVKIVTAQTFAILLQEQRG